MSSVISAPDCQSSATEPISLTHTHTHLSDGRVSGFYQKTDGSQQQTDRDRLEEDGRTAGREALNIPAAPVLWPCPNVNKVLSLEKHFSDSQQKDAREKQSI